MEQHMMPAIERVFSVDSESLSVCDECLAVEGASDDSTHSVHLRFIESGDTSVELFRFELPEGGELIAVNGVLASSRKDALLKEASERGTITLLVTETDEKVRFGSGYPEPKGLDIEQSA
jgi:hypothetical protein